MICHLIIAITVETVEITNINNFYSMSAFLNWIDL